ncbi:DUF3800 domain-containing protein [Bacteroides pyogenes]|nr:DUF3800 domain-containing protein [Bacteroides pyogenes]
MLYFDEAGYTGGNLTDKIHPFFTLASTDVSESEMKTIKEAIDYDTWGKELHFKKMYRTYEGRRALEKLFSYPLMNRNHVKLAFANKRYCVYAQIVNILIETFVHNQGGNLYKGAQNLLIANHMYYGAVLHPNQKLVGEFEDHFVMMVRQPSVETVAIFYRTTDKLRFDNGCNKMLKDMLAYIPQTITCIREALNVKSLYMDLTIPLFVNSIEKWYGQTGVKHSVWFDQSEPFFANKALLESLRDMKAEETEVGYGSNKHIYPLPVDEMKIVESHNSFGIQIADVFASALNFVLTPRTDKYKDYQKKLSALPIFQSVDINVAPSTVEYLEQRRKDIDGIDPLDFICEHTNLDN